MKMDSPCYYPSHKPENILEYHIVAIEFLNAHKLPPSPLNYAVAYDYAARANEDLAAELDKRLQRSGSADSHLMEELFRSFFITDFSLELEGQIAGLHQVLFQVLQGVSGASAGMSSFDQVLKSQLDELKSNPGVKTLQNITVKLASATEKAMESNRVLHNHIEQVEQEASQLRDELDKSREEASTDGLTGLDNRKSLVRKMDELIDANDENKEPLSVLMIDIDHFKRYNDSYGHIIGDEVIRRVATTVQQNVRGSDITARYGGEEFAVVLPETALEGAMAVAKNIHKAISKLVLIKRSTKEQLPGITVSVGASARRRNEKRDDLLDRADQALYLAKRSGRNRIMSEVDLGIKPEIVYA